MKIGFDFDDTIYNTEDELTRLLEIKCKKANKPFKYIPTLPSCNARCNITREELDDIWFSLDKYNPNKLKPDAIEWLLKRQALGDTLVCVTARYIEKGMTEDIAEEIKKCLAYVGLYNIEVYTNAINKLTVCNTLGLDYMIDDSFEIYNQFWNENASCKFILYNTPFFKNTPKPSTLNIINKWEDLDTILSVN